MVRNIGTTARLRHLWVVAALAYGVARVALAGAFLARYGLNVWVFGVIEMSSSVLLGLASGRLIESILRAERGRRVLLVSGTLVGYAAPDAYVLTYSGEFPTSTLVVVAIVIGAGTIASTVGMRMRLRRALPAATGPSGHSGQAN